MSSPIIAPDYTQEPKESQKSAAQPSRGCSEFVRCVLAPSFFGTTEKVWNWSERVHSFRRFGSSELASLWPGEKRRTREEVLVRLSPVVYSTDSDALLRLLALDAFRCVRVCRAVDREEGADDVQFLLPEVSMSVYASPSLTLP